MCMSAANGGLASSHSGALGRRSYRVARIDIKAFMLMAESVHIVLVLRVGFVNLKDLSSLNLYSTTPTVLLSVTASVTCY